MLGQTLAVLGLQSFYLGCIVQVLYNYSPRAADRWLRLFSYNRAMVISGALLAAGVAMCVPLCVQYVQMGLTLSLITGIRNHLAANGLLLLIFGFLTFCNTLVLHTVKLRVRPRLLAAEESPLSCKIAS
jgi:phosphotransferase system  glucose/maltose/N-acetylglucosamine-specific IIC component